MALPSFNSQWRDGQRIKPAIYVLEIHGSDKLDDDPVAWLLVERQETYHQDPSDGSILKASIRLSYERIIPKHSHRDGGKGQFSAGYERGFRKEPFVALASTSISKGAIFLDLPRLHGLKIGTYLMNELVTWVQQWPEAAVYPIELLAGQAEGENKARRNRFYEQFGVVFDYRDAEAREGLSRPMLVKDLKPVHTWKANIRERDVRSYLGEGLHKYDHMKRELAQSERAVKSLSDELGRANDRPLVWAMRRLWWRFAPSLLVAAVVLVMGAMIWMRLKPE